MPGRILLDTSAVIDLFAGDPGAREIIGGAAEVLVPAVVVGELLFGALRSRRAAENLAQVRAFRDAVAVLPCDTGTAEHYAGLKARLAASGRPLPENDVWIGALAIQHRAPVLTRDAHFRQMSGVELHPW